ncbi:TPA: M28 family peptidase [Candidatus Poribacteria bacterium]|nr:M28 family peptidase [Candidatus Poribacteria bacterium]
MELKQQFKLTQWLLLLGLLSFARIEAATPEFDAEHAFQYLVRQCEFGPRNPGSNGHENAKKYLISELKRYSKEVVTQEFEYTDKQKSLKLTNIMARFGKKDGEKILLAAHWDTRPFAEHDPNPEKRNTPIIGANDGASGVAVLLEIARTLKSKPPENEIFIVFFDGEDYGKHTSEMFLGSRYFAGNMERWKPDYGILLDMVGDKELDLPIEQFSLRAAPELTQRVWQTAKDLGLDAFHPQLGPAIMDDHVSLIEAGVPCIDIIDFDYPYWHTTEDTPDKCSAESLGTLGKLILALIY